jgi:hypothetical protein
MHSRCLTVPLPPPFLFMTANCITYVYSLRCLSFFFWTSFLAHPPFRSMDVWKQLVFPRNTRTQSELV